MTKRLHQIPLVTGHTNTFYSLITRFFDSGDHIFATRDETEYKLHKALEVGDVISAFGQFKDHTTSKFR